MALTYCTLASGSGGNCLWVKGGGVEILVDCGISARATALRLESIGHSLKDVSAVVCTHGHGDHIAGASVLLRRHDLRLYATDGTRRMLPAKLPQEQLEPLAPNGRTRIGGLTVRTVPTPHDAPESVALAISDHESALGIVTDLGTPTGAVAELLSSVDALVLESNHDLQMLADGPYPQWLKKRIQGNFGHLSNEQGAALLLRLAHPKLQQVTLAHLSEENNTPDLARAAAEAVLGRSSANPRLRIAEQANPGEPFQVRVRGQMALPF